MKWPKDPKDPTDWDEDLCLILFVILPFSIIFSTVTGYYVLC